MIRLFLAVLGLFRLFFLTEVPAGTSDGDGKNTAGAAGGDLPASPPNGGDKTFTQADVDRIVQERLAKEQQRTTAKLEAERKKADEDALAKNAEWQTLAEQRQRELDALKPQAALAATLIDRMNGQIDAEVAGWADEIKALDPGTDNLTARLDWVEKARALNAKIATPPKPPATQMGHQGGKTAESTAADRSSAPSQATPYRWQQPGDVQW